MEKKKNWAVLILKRLFWGISWGCTFFVLTALIGYLTAGKAFLEPILEDFAAQALGAMLVGIFCGSTAIVYDIERLAPGMRIFIHFTVGLGGYLCVAYKLQWMPVDNFGHILAFILTGVFVFMIIWAAFYFHNRREAQKVNKRLKELERSEEKPE